MGGPFLGPFVAAWLITAVSWRADYGVLAGLHGISTLIVIFIGDETLYDRRNPQSKEHGVWARFRLIVGIAGLQTRGRPSPWTVFKDLLSIQVKPHILLITVGYVMILVAWVIGVNTTISQFVSSLAFIDHLWRTR